MKVLRKSMNAEGFNFGANIGHSSGAGIEDHLHYHEFVDACLGKAKCTAPFSYSARLTETILLGVIAGRFPNKKLHWDSKRALFNESEANQFLDSKYRVF